MDIRSDNEQILTDLKKIIEDTGGDSILKMVLYGSRARGDYDVESDIDIAVIVRGLTRELKNRLLDAVADIELTYLVPLSVLVLSEEDFEFLKKRERRIALDMEKEGIPL
ncbi:MAG: nucleotidyltransferase domain-containing protein [Nitrospirae bacterium]|nr:nucleotidyltransferase domain-containing protein [Nitrospirota bacterium]